MKYVIVRGYDWKGLYIDGVLAEKNHKIGIEHLQRHGLLPDLEFADVDDDWIEERGGLPIDLRDVQFEGGKGRDA